MIKCKNCRYWHNKQRVVNYVEKYGICEGIPAAWEEGQDLQIMPHEELYLQQLGKHVNDDHSLKEYEYDIITYESFGCNKGV